MKGVSSAGYSFVPRQVGAQTQVQKLPAASAPLSLHQLYWGKAKAQIMCDMIDKRMESLEQALGHLQLEMPGQPELLRKVKNEFHQLDLARRRVKNEGAVGLKEFTLAQDRFVSAFQDAVKTLQADPGYTAQQEDRLKIYGGALGNSIFSMILTGHTKPALKAFLQQFVHDTKSYSRDDLLMYARYFLPQFLLIATQDRGVIARLSNSAASDTFGAFFPEHGCLEDPVATWPSWNTAMVRKFNALIEPSWQNYHQANPDAGFAGFLRNLVAQTMDGPAIEFRDPDGKTILRLHPAAHECGEGRGVCGADPTLGVACADYTFHWSVTDQADAPMTFREPYCTHSPVKGEVLIDLLAPSFLDALACKEAYSGDILKQSILTIQHQMSHASYIQRGQASITELLIDAIGDHVGVIVQWGPEYTDPHPRPDMHALLEFHLEDFLVDAAQYLSLLPK